MAFFAVADAMYFDYPLEQGLRQQLGINQSAIVAVYFDYPLEQGLRRKCRQGWLPRYKYFDYPLEQGLRHLVEVTCIG